MKIVFLDVDGVLNSDAYDRVRKEGEPNVDESRLALLRGAIERTNAKIVLTSTWRKHWSPLESERTEKGRELHALFARNGLEIYDKTPDFGKIYERKREIASWLAAREGIVEKFVVVDDLPFGWEEFGEYLVRTDGRIGRGLEEAHVEKIVALLK